MTLYTPPITADVANDGTPPAAWGLIGMNYHPSCAPNVQILTAGVLYVVKMYMPACTITDVVMVVTTAGATLTSGQSFVGLYDHATSGTQRAASLTQHTAWQTAGTISSAMTTPYVFAGGYFYVAFYCGAGTTMPTFSRCANNQFATNPNLAATLPAAGFANTGLTTALPGTLGTMTNTTAVGWWVGLKGTLA